FHIPMTDYRQIDISADVQVCRVMGRLGFVSEDPSVEAVVRIAKELHSEFPGIFDLAVWDIGRSICRPVNPRCPKCPLNDLCAYANRDQGPLTTSLIGAMGADLANLSALRDQGLITAADYDAKKADWLRRL
ncbi:MAG TPA: hypothetical protein VFR68_09040, partial [Candidatus Dormibacteraeota bacterium]|nr:hypothetical protein [Candidatus Dormibacteraeota bacterium]